MEYFERILLGQIKKWIDRREIIAIKGPRQSGKTTLLEMMKEWLIKKGIKMENIIFITFEDREALEKFSLNPKDFVKRFISENEKYYFLIDEAHYCKDLGQKLKLLYDLYKNVKFIITGSSSLEITSETAKFLVGRMFSFELLPFNFYEFLLTKDKKLARIFLERKEKIDKFIFEGENLEVKDDIFIDEISRYLDEYLVFGGYPEVLKAKDEEEKKIVLKNIFNTYLEKDIVSYLQLTDTIKFRKLVSSLSFLIGNMISYNKIVSSCNSYFKEIIHMLDVLQQTYIIKLLRPLHKNLITELRKNPKVYFFDHGIRNYSINNFNSLFMRADAGFLAENFVSNEIETENFLINFWRTTAKAEVDFVLSSMNETIPIEVKFESFKREGITRSMRSFIEAYKPKRALIITKDFWGETTINKTKIKFVPVCYV